MNYIDVYNMTREFAITHHDIANQMTYDHVHWGMELNLIKAQIIINAIIKGAQESQKFDHSVSDL